jgi:AAA domain (dynein-related subfamily)/CbbQ/NirQ/NorQ C-terminal
MTTPLQQFINDIIANVPDVNSGVKRSVINEIHQKTGNNKGYHQFITSPQFRISRGLYSLPSNDADTATAPAPSSTLPKKEPVQMSISKNLTPSTDPNFVPFGDYRIIFNLVKSGSFFPVYISGESGNGKTKMVYEACAKAKRELIRANITEVTDEDDLIGGFRLQDGNTVWQDGPAIEAMKRGAVLLLDEINLGSPKIMCLQPILEGNPIYVKKTNELVHPAPGFTVIATSNTKGKGSIDGRYIGSNILNEAFLDRFAITIEHDYPPKAAESKILQQILQKENTSDPDVLDFCAKLVEWAAAIRATFKEGAIDEVITTRRLIHIMNFYVFGNKNRMKAIDYCISRFDDEIKASFRSLYQKFDETVKVEQITPSYTPIESETPIVVPF